MSGAQEHTAELDGLPVFWRSAPPPAAPAGHDAPAAPAGHDAPAAPAGHDAPAAPAGHDAPAASAGHDAPAASASIPVLYLHGVPSSSEEWAPFLERSGGIAPDLPGFGRSGKPGYLKYTIGEYASFLQRFLDMLGVERVKLVVHDWGAVGLAFAQEHPQRIERLVVTNAVPFLPSYRWHRTARVWRTPLLGELAMGASTRWVFKQATRESNVTPGPLPKQWLDSVMSHFDEGTQRAILRLYRSSPTEVLAKAGERLGALEIPALVVWGARDPYIPVRFAEAYAQALPQAKLRLLPDAGHWWWLDRPDAIDDVLEFLAGD